jgi:chromosomal replication initiator protein
MNLWDEILARVETKVNRHSFYTWFRPTAFVSEDRISVTVRVPNASFKDWLTKHYSGVITEATQELKRPDLLVTFIAEAQVDAPVIPLGPDEAAVLESGPPPTTQPGPAGLNPRYTFDTFIVGSSNQFAHAACRAVAEAPSRSTLAVHLRRRGIGQTHLMHAVATTCSGTIAI